MPDNFGTPEARDAVARDEKTVQEAGQYAVDLDNATKEMYPRSLGSVKISPQDRAKEYEMARATAEAGDPSHMAQILVDVQANTLEKIVSYLKTMESKR